MAQQIPGFEGFELADFDAADDVRIRYRHGGSGPPLLLLHGNPQTHVSWHKLAAPLAERFHVVAADLRGYGDSDKPAATPDHAAHSKRAMAADMVALMRALGHERFDIVGLSGAGEIPREVTVRADPDGGVATEFKAVVRIDTPREADYYRHGGILHYVLRQLRRQIDTHQVRPRAQDLAQLDERGTGLDQGQSDPRLVGHAANGLAVAVLEDLLGEFQVQAADPIGQPVLAKDPEHLDRAVEVAIDLGDGGDLHGRAFQERPFTVTPATTAD